MGTVDVEVIAVPSSRGGRFGYIAPNRHRAYKALRRKGMSKSRAAAISNKGRTRAGRSAMGRKAARTRRARGRR